MAKTNSLKIVPIAKRYGRRDPEDYSTRADLLIGYELMEYTTGKPGEQSTSGNSKAFDYNTRTYYDTGIDYDIDWRPNDPFDATLTIRRLERGRSAARFWFEDEATKTMYPFFGQTLVDMLTNADMIKGKVRGTWIVVKKGANYGIELYQP